MTMYIIYFNQQWVGDHTAEWFASRGPLARAVVDDMSRAGVLVTAGGLEEDIDAGWGFDSAGAATPPISSGTDFLGGLTIIDVATDDEAKTWGSKVAEACGWPQEVRRFTP